MFLLLPILESTKEKVTVCRSWNCTFFFLFVWFFFLDLFLLWLHSHTIVQIYVFILLCVSAFAEYLILYEFCFLMQCRRRISYQLYPILHQFNVKFPKLVTLQVHRIYCVVRRFFFFFVSATLRYFADLGRSHFVFQTTNFITALIFISVFCSIHCTCILQFHFGILFIFMTNQKAEKRERE